MSLRHRAIDETPNPPVRAADNIYTSRCNDICNGVLLPRLLSPEEKLPACHNLNTWRVESIWEFQPRTASPPRCVAIRRPAGVTLSHKSHTIRQKQLLFIRFPDETSGRPFGAGNEGEKKKNDLRDGFARSGVVHGGVNEVPATSRCRRAATGCVLILAFMSLAPVSPLEPNASRYFN